jgi:hypothetical protein
MFSTDRRGGSSVTIVSGLQAGRPGIDGKDGEGIICGYEVSGIIFQCRRQIFFF